MRLSISAPSVSVGKLPENQNGAPAASSSFAYGLTTLASTNSGAAVAPFFRNVTLCGPLNSQRTLSPARTVTRPRKKRSTSAARGSPAIGLGGPA